MARSAASYHTTETGLIVPYFGDETSVPGPPSERGETPPPPPPGGIEVDIATLKTHVGWIAKGLGGLAFVGLAAFAWIFYNVFQPVKDIQRDIAVQGTVLEQIKTNVSDIKSDLRDLNDRLDRENESQRSNQTGQNSPVHR